MANGQTGLPLAAPVGGGASFVSTGKKGGIDLDQVLPLLLLVSPLLEMRSPGSGMGLAAGIVGYQKEKQEKRRRDSMGLLQMLSEIDDDQIETAIGALADAGYDPQLVKAMAKASRGMVDPARKAERALNQLVEDPSLGLIPRRTQIDIQARQQATEQDITRESAINERERLEEEARFRREQEARAAETGAGRKFSLEGEARSLLISLSMNPALSPQARARVSQLAQRLAAGEDPQAIIAEASALAGEVGQAGAAQDLQQRQTAFRQRRLAELEAEVESAVPAAAERIRRLAKEQGLNPAPYLQRLAQNIKRQKLQEQVLARQAAGPQGGGLSLSDLKLAAFLGQIDPSKLSDEQRKLIGLPLGAKAVPLPTRKEVLERRAKIVRRLAALDALAKETGLTAIQRDKFAQEYDDLLDEQQKLEELLGRMHKVNPRGR